MEIRVFKDQETQAKEAAERVTKWLKEALMKRKKVSLAVSGGKTPKAFFKCLSEMDLPWERVVITLVDERWIPVDHPESNEALVRRYLLCGKASRAVFLGLKNQASTPQEGLSQAEEALASLPRPIEVVVLGLGEDGHTASLFPGALGLDHALHSPGLLAPVIPEKAPHQRLTLTLAALLEARHLLLLVTGERKLSVLKAALNQGPEEEMPIRFLLRSGQRPVEIYWAP